VKLPNPSTDEIKNKRNKLRAGFLYELSFELEDGSDMYVRIVGRLSTD
jgi:hypothetical protein